MEYFKHKHTSVSTFLLGIGYDMGIYPIPIPKIHNIFGYFGYEYWVDTQKSWVFWVYKSNYCQLFKTQMRLRNEYFQCPFNAQ